MNARQIWLYEGVFLLSLTLAGYITGGTRRALTIVFLYIAVVALANGLKQQARRNNK